MSKQVKLKFKKLLKKAEFVHADLEYHEELFPDAQREFFVAVNEILSALPDDERARMDAIRSQRLMAPPPRPKEENEEEEELSGLPTASELFISPDHPEGIELSPDAKDLGEPGIKSTEAKKLFYRIAELTHPDKLINQQLSKTEMRRLERFFITATGAYNSLNWYILYSIALELGLDVDDPREEYLNWIEEDIRLTMGTIASIGAKIVWVWYTGDENSKKFALGNYFQQVYNYTLEE